MQNDFLSSLSSRAIRDTRPEPVAGDLAPRPLSLFEPAAAPALPALDAMRDPGTVLEVEAPPVPAAQPVARPPAQPDSQQNQPAPAAAQHNPARQPPASAAQEKPAISPRPTAMPEERRPSALIIPAPMAATPARNDTPETGTEQQRQTAESLRSGRMPQTDATIRTISEQVIITRQELSPRQKDTLQALSELTGHKTPAPASPAPLAQQSPEKQASAKITPEQILVTHRELPPSAGSQPPQLVPAAAPERKTQTNMPQNEAQPASIHVTIGRIEIKASSPAAAPKRGTPSATSTSLDEYLRRRHEGSHP